MGGRDGDAVAEAVGVFVVADSAVLLAFVDVECARSWVRCRKARNCRRAAALRNCDNDMVNLARAVVLASFEHVRSVLGGRLENVVSCL